MVTGKTVSYGCCLNHDHDDLPANDDEDATDCIDLNFDQILILTLILPLPACAEVPRVVRVFETDNCVPQSYQDDYDHYYGDDDCHNYDLYIWTLKLFFGRAFFLGHLKLVTPVTA